MEHTRFIGLDIHKEQRLPRRASMSATLSDLDRLLVERGFRRSSPSDSSIAKERQNEHSLLLCRASVGS